MSSKCPYDPFEHARTEKGVLNAELDGDNIPMVLRYRDLKTTAKNWQTFSSDAPFRVPIPAEENVRTVKQLPLEVDPPEHRDYRKIAEGFFRKPLEPEFQQRIEALIEELLEEAGQRDTIEIVREFSLPLQSRALTYLLGVPESEAEELISWGLHVFRTGDGKQKGARMEAYINEWLDKAEANPGDDFYSGLTQATYQGRKLTREEMAGFCNIMFAGGRDTIINSVSFIMGYFAHHPEHLNPLREDPKMIMTATEEFVRYVSPVTHIGRVCPNGADVHGIKVEPGERITLAFASANHDETVFENPHEIQLDRKPNPHVGFGSGIHNCLGAHHARLIMRTLIAKLCERLDSAQVIEAVENVEKEKDFERTVSYSSLQVKLSLKPKPSESGPSHS